MSDAFQRRTVSLAFAAVALVLFLLVGALSWAWFCARFGLQEASASAGYLVGWALYLGLVALLVAAYAFPETLLERRIGRRMAEAIRSWRRKR